MKDRQKIRQVPIAVIAGVCGFVLAAGGGIAWWTTQNANLRSSQSSAPPTVPAASPSPSNTPSVIIPVPVPSPAQIQPSQGSESALKPQSPLPLPSGSTTNKTVQVYWLKDTGGNFQIVPDKLATQGIQKPDTAIKGAFEHLLAGPTDANAQSEIPKGTKLESVKVVDDGVYVNLSEEFTSGGGSTSMIGRLGQVIFTATSLQPDAKVWISVDGKPLKILGGEGLEVAWPSTRSTFEKDFALQ